MLLHQFLLDGPRNQLFPQAANFHAPGHQVGVEQSQQNHQTQHQGTRYGEFEVNVALLEKGRRKKYSAKPGAHQQAGQGHDQPQLSIPLFELRELLANPCQYTLSLCLHSEITRRVQRVTV